MANSKIRRVPNRRICGLILRKLWDWGISGIPPEALPYMIGSYTMDTSRLQRFLGADYAQVIQYTVEEALQDSFKESVAAERCKLLGPDTISSRATGRRCRTCSASN